MEFGQDRARVVHRLAEGKLFFHDLEGSPHAFVHSPISQLSTCSLHACMRAVAMRKINSTRPRYLHAPKQDPLASSASHCLPSREI